MDQKHKQTGPS